jgi:hypothetical protein
VQRLVAVPDPVRDLAFVVLADAPAQRVVGEADQGPVGARDLGELAYPIPLVVLRLF